MELPLAQTERFPEAIAVIVTPRRRRDVTPSRSTPWSGVSQLELQTHVHGGPRPLWLPVHSRRTGQRHRSRPFAGGCATTVTA
jgi:hypothetical protein